MCHGEEDVFTFLEWKMSPEGIIKDDKGLKNSAARREEMAILEKCRSTQSAARPVTEKKVFKWNKKCSNCLSLIIFRPLGVTSLGCVICVKVLKIQVLQ